MWERYGFPVSSRETNKDCVTLCAHVVQLKFGSSVTLQTHHFRWLAVNALTVTLWIINSDPLLHDHIFQNTFLNSVYLPCCAENVSKPYTYIQVMHPQPLPKVPLSHSQNYCMSKVLCQRWRMVWLKQLPADEDCWCEPATGRLFLAESLPLPFTVGRMWCTASPLKMQLTWFRAPNTGYMVGNV